MTANAYAKPTKTASPRTKSDVDLKALAAPFVLLAVLFTTALIVARWGLVPEISCWVLFVLGLQVWGLQLRRRTRREVRTEIERHGCKVLEMKSRFFKLGPFSMWNSSRTQSVYRVVVQENTGRERIVWARSGRRWFWNRDTLELKWEQ